MTDLFLSAGLGPAPTAAHWLLLILSVIFMALPVLGLVTAVDPTSRSPGVGLLINLKTGQSSGATGAIRILLISHPNSSGSTITVNSDVIEGLADADAVATYLGQGSLGHLTAARLFEEFPAATVDLVAPAEPSGVVATTTITFDDTTPVSVEQTVVVEIAGREFEIQWAAAETDITAATRLVAKITALSKILPVTATNVGGTSAVVTLTAKSKGTWGNDVKVKARLKDGTGGSVSPTSLTNMTSGTTEPVLTTVLTLVQEREYRLIVPCLSNTDVALASATGGMGRIKTHITAHNSGIGALLQSAHSACTDSTTNAKAMSNQHDFEFFSHHLIRGGRSLPCEWAGAIVGIYARHIRVDPAYNFIHTVFKATLYGSPTIDADALTAAEREDLLFSGVAFVDYTAQKAPRLARPITTYFEDSSGNPDDRVIDVCKPFGTMAVAADLRTETERAWANKKLAAALPAGATAIPPDIVTEATARAFIIGRIRDRWVSTGVVRGDRLDEVIEDGTLVIQVDPLDETQLDTFLPLRIVPPFVKHSIVIVQA